MKLIGVVNELNFKYTDEYIRDIVKKYDGKPISEFLKDNPSLYTTIQNKGKEYFNDVTKNMIRKIKTWTDDEIRSIAQKYKTKKDFKDNDFKAFVSAKNRGMDFYHDITSHMTMAGGNKYNRAIYVYEFRTKGSNKPVAAYVGLTYDVDVRNKQHTDINNPKFSAVKNFMIKNPELKMEHKQLTDYIPNEEALNKEKYYEDLYKNSGWIILNIKRAGGSLGSSFTITDEYLKSFVDKCYKEGLTLTDMKKKFPNQTNLIYKRKLHLEPYNYLEKFIRTKSPKYTDETAFNKAMEYKSLSDMRINNPKLYYVLHKRKLINKVKDKFNI